MEHQYVITFEAASQYSDTKAVDDMLKMITGYCGHIDFIMESNSRPACHDRTGTEGWYHCSQHKKPSTSLCLSSKFDTLNMVLIP